MARIRFHLDEHVHPAIAVGLQARGVDVTTAQNAGLGGASDREQVAQALIEGRTIVTHDRDYLRLHAEGVDHAGIAYCHQQKCPASISGC
jgi:predicted nuclease of predicted toxin-antitoxin system